MALAMVDGGDGTSGELWGLDHVGMPMRRIVLIQLVTGWQPGDPTVP